MKNMLKENVFWFVIVLLILPLLEFMPIELSEKGEFLLAIAFIVLGFLSFLATILVFWVAYYGNGKLIAIVSAIGYIVLATIHEYLYLLGIFIVVGYWVSLKPKITQYVQKI